MRWLVVSLAIHALALWLIVRGDTSRARIPVRTTAHGELAPIEIAVIELASGGGGAPASAAAASATPRRSSRALSVHGPRARARDPWSRLSIRTEAVTNSAGIGDGTGTGHGDGRGTGLGFGAGSGMRVPTDVPPPPVPVAPPASKARPARLIWPDRDVEVIDDSYLFVARVTVDEDGAVVGARMLTMRPGSRAEHAANAIWQFRYEPALDEHGVPVRSTFEQPFQVR